MTTANNIYFKFTMDNNWWSGTDDKIEVAVFGADWSSGRLHLDDPNRNDFEENSTSDFTVDIGSSENLQHDPGDIFAIKIFISPQAGNREVDAIQLTNIEVIRKDGANNLGTYNFPFYHSVLGDEGDGSGDPELDADRHELLAFVNRGPVEDYSSLFADTDDEDVVYKRHVLLIDRTGASARAESNPRPTLETTFEYASYFESVRALSENNTVSVAGSVGVSAFGIGAEGSISEERSTEEVTEESIGSSVSVTHTHSMPYDDSVAADKVKVVIYKHKVTSAVQKAELGGKTYKVYTPRDWDSLASVVEREAESIRALAEMSVVQSALDVSNADDAETALSRAQRR